MSWITWNFKSSPGKNIRLVSYSGHFRGSGNILSGHQKMMKMQIIEIKELVKRFPMGKGEFTALRGIDLEFGQGEFAGLIGPSGSGKTTLLNIIGSLDSPSQGRVEVLGQSVGNMNAREAARLRKESMGFIFQSYNLLQVHTVYENVEFPLLLLKYDHGKRKKMVMDALEWVGLTDKVNPSPRSCRAANARGLRSPGPW
jgi:putative ABC transport system ATP-binding protein